MKAVWKTHRGARGSYKSFVCWRRQVPLGMELALSVLLLPDMLRRLYDQFVVLNEAILSAPKIDYGTKLD